MTAEHFHVVAGLKLGTAPAGIKRQDRDDLLVIEAWAGTTAAAVFTRNAFCAAPVRIARLHLPEQPRWLLVNAGNANAGTGERGMQDALKTCAALAARVGAAPEAVLPFSTGVIGEYLPVEKIEAALPAALAHLAPDHWPEAARAIMTTDTRPKLASRRIEVAGIAVNLTGIAKGAGMIHPDMATLLVFLATDAALDQPLLQSVLTEAVEDSFNAITVDGDTSTNDACVLLATGASGVVLAADHPACPAFCQALLSLCQELAEAVIRDGEGATKLMRIQVETARDKAEAHQVALTIAHSPLVKTAFFASDPNWGRLLAAVGRSGCPELDVSRVNLWLDEVAIVRQGERAADYTEQAGQAVMARDEITVRVDLGRGSATRVLLTCDFSYDYVRINAEYRT
jgi:glutamate N-acetyltransferase/amino-acid N-acetyltransferase